MPFWNESRGLRIEGTNFSYLSEGAFGVVFADKTAARIRKVYRTLNKVDLATATFDSEVAAYEIASADEGLRTLIPKWFGPRTVQTIVDGNDNDVSNEFFSDLCFEAEFIPGRFQKFRNLSDAERHRVTQSLCQQGNWLCEGYVGSRPERPGFSSDRLCA